ncbi:MAG: hypothetical protein REI94_15050 [Moraxellaceae bacterium]|nr:hypothetical protein [Moraxellaceae bacterium]
MDRNTYLLTSWQRLPADTALRHITGLTVRFTPIADAALVDTPGPVAFAWRDEQQWLGHIVAGRDLVADWVHRELAGQPSWRDHLQLTLARLMSEAGECFRLAGGSATVPAAAQAATVTSVTSVTSARTC